jgi:hypothetical protein
MHCLYPLLVNPIFAECVLYTQTITPRRVVSLYAENFLRMELVTAALSPLGMRFFPIPLQVYSSASHP